MLVQLIAAMVMAVFAGLVIVAIRGSRPPSPAQTEIVIGRNGADWLRSVAAGLSGLPGHRLDELGPQSLQVLWRRRPIWTLAVAVFFFPFGLVALLVVRYDQCSISVCGPESQPRALIGGIVSQRAVEAINATLDG